SNACKYKLARNASITSSFGACWPTGGHKKVPPLRNSTSLIYPMAFCELSRRESRTLGVSLHKVQSKFRISKMARFSLNFDRLGERWSLKAELVLVLQIRYCSYPDAQVVPTTCRLRAMSRRSAPQRSSHGLLPSYS